MEWTQIAAWIVWAWVGLTTVIATLGLLAVLKGEPSHIEFEKDRIEHAKVTDMALSVAKAFALNAILGLMLIQTLDLKV